MPRLWDSELTFRACIRILANNGPQQEMLSIKLLDVPIALLGLDTSNDQRLRTRYHAWLNDEPPALTVTVHLQDGVLANERRHFTTEFRDHLCLVTAPGYQGQIDLAAGCATLVLTSIDAAQEIDYFIRVIVALLAFEHGGILLHAAAVVRHGRGHLFLGHSGAGKSTLVRLSTLLPDTYALNDDLVFVGSDSTGWYLSATPFWNWETPATVRLGPQTRAPLTAIYQLQQSRDDRLAAVPQATATALLLTQCPTVSLDQSRFPSLMVRLRALAAAVPAATLHFRRATSFWYDLDTFT
jgi:hypothetical protein